MAAEALELAAMPRYGFEKQGFHDGLGAGERLYGLGLIASRGGAARVKLELGGWIARNPGRRSSLQASLSLGYRVSSGPGAFVEAYVGPAWISATDSQLSTHFQIAHDLAVGFQDGAGWGVALAFKHLSNAGIRQPNRGRDFFGLCFLMPLGAP